MAESAGLGEFSLVERDPELRLLGRGPLVPKSAATRRRERRSALRAGESQKLRVSRKFYLLYDRDRITLSHDKRALV